MILIRKSIKLNKKLIETSFKLNKKSKGYQRIKMKKSFKNFAL